MHTEPAIEAHDILVDTGSPTALDTIVQQLGPAVVVGAPNYVRIDGHYVVRVFGPSDFIKFALTQQGYATVIQELDHLV